MPALFAQLGPLVTGSLWMGLWAAAAALPILIHLLNRRQYREEPWAAMEYLLRAMKKNARRIRIEQMLLLLIRAMILVLAALAWMDLMLSGGIVGPTGEGGGNTHTVLLIDGSYSMAARDGDTTRFERAQQLAAEVVDAAGRGDAFTLVLMGEPPQVIIPQPAFDPQDIRQELSALRLPHAGANLSSSLASAEKLLQEVREKHKRIDAQRVCIFTDLGATTWANITTDEIDTRIRRIGEAARTTLFDVAERTDRQGRVDNTAVTGLRLRDAYVVLGRDVVFQAQIRNFGPVDRANLSVQFVVDDRTVGRQTIDLAAGSEASLAFTHRFETPGEHVVRVQLPDDALAIDNRRRLSVPVRPALNVLCVSGKPGAADHVALALSPSKTGESTIQTEVATESALLERELASYDCVILCNVGRFGQDEATVLHEYAHNGGGVVVFLGDQVAAESYNRWLAGEDDEGSALLPAKLGEIAATGEYRFDPRGYEHPIVDAFRGHQRTGLLTTPIWKYYKLNVGEDSPAKVALWLDSGDPAIVEQPIGRGRAILVATSASDDSLDRTTSPPTPWTVFSTWPSFPPLVHEMLAAGVSGRFQNRNVLVGQPLDSSVNSTAVGIPLTVYPPQVGDPPPPPERVRLELDGDVSVWSFASTEQSGIYRAEFGEPISKTELYAVNVDARESDLSRISVEDLPAQWQQELEQAAGGASTAALAGPRRYLYHWFLGGVLVLLLAETFVAWHVGNRSI